MADEQETPPSNLGQVITDRLTDVISNLNIREALENIVATKPQDEESEEIRRKLEGVLNKYNAMSDDERMSFQNQVKATLNSKLSSNLQEKLGDVQGAIEGAIMYRLMLLAAGVVVLIILLVFFGYKLYKSLKEKEVKREEKKKAKQMKKKK